MVDSDLHYANMCEYPYYQIWMVIINCPKYPYYRTVTVVLNSKPVGLFF